MIFSIPGLAPGVSLPFDVFQLTPGASPGYSERISGAGIPFMPLSLPARTPARAPVA